MSSDRSITFRPWLFAIALLASGCVLAPKGAKLERARLAEAGDTYDTPVAERVVPELPPDADWRALLRHAFLSNGDLEAAYFVWAAAVQRIDIAAGYPNTNVSVGFEYMFSGENLKSWDRSTLTFGFDPMQNLSFPTKVMAAGRVAYEDARAAGWRFAQAKFALQRQVLEAWLDYALLAEQRRLQRDRIALLRLGTETAAARVQTGMRQQDLLAAEVALRRAEVEQRTLDAAVPQQQVRLNSLVGRPPGAPLALPGALPAPRPLPSDDAALLTVAANRSPELAALAHDVAGRADALDLARQQYFPDVNPFVGFEGSIAQVVGATVTFATMIPQIRAGIREATLNLRGSEALLRQARRERSAEFVAALLMLRNAERQSAMLEQHILPFAELAAGSAAQATAAGAAELSAVIEAEDALIDLRGAIAEARIARERQLAALEQLAGVDVETLIPSPRAGEGQEGGFSITPSAPPSCPSPAGGKELSMIVLLVAGRAAMIEPIVRIALLVAFAAGTPAVGAETPRAHAAQPTAERQLYTCGMHPQVIRDEPGVCPICGMELTPLKAGGGAAPKERKILYWWDPMLSPPYISDKPGKSPMGMDLVPVYEDAVAAGPAVVIDPAIVQNMGVRVATAAEGPLRRTLRAVGYLVEAQPNQHDVNLRVSGWIEKLYADVEGMHVQAGTPLFDLYSPELQVAIEELIAARRAAAVRGAEQLLRTAERKLELLGLSRAQIVALARLDTAPPAVTFTSPVTGHVVEKPIVDGAAVAAGTRALRIVDHSSLWLDIAIFEQQLPFVRLGQTARTSVLAMPGRSFDGTISFIHPHVDPTTRTVMARVVVTNPGLQLRPGMYATVEIDSELAPRTLLVPRAAVIDTGTKQVVFVARSHGHFDPRRVTVGASGDNEVEILAGLAPGEQVVTSGQFLLDAESRFRDAIQRFLSDASQGAEGPRPGGAHVH